jgi:hypothetical protein
MSQAPGSIVNMSRTLFRAAVNAVTQALQSLNSGTTEPDDTFPYMLWADTTTGLLKQRNAADNGWVSVLSLATGLPVGAAKAGVDDRITELTGLTTPLSKEQGGTGGGTPTEGYIYIRDEKSSGTGGGGFTNGAWRTRTLNTEVIDAGGHSTLASNQVTLAAGTYRFAARAPGFQVDGHKVKLVNITDTIDYVGSSANSNPIGYEQTDSFVRGRFTIAGAKVFELQHRCQTTNGTNGLGGAAFLSVNEVYAELEFWKEL